MTPNTATALGCLELRCGLGRALFQTPSSLTMFRDMALRATGLSERSLRAIREMIEIARAVEGLAVEDHRNRSSDGDLGTEPTSSVLAA